MRLLTSLLLPALALLACNDEPTLFPGRLVDAGEDASSDTTGGDADPDVAAADTAPEDDAAPEQDASVDTGVPSGLMLRSPFADEETFAVETRGIFAFWWDPQFDHAGDIDQMYEWLEAVRQESLVELGMADPPNPGAGYYYNIYIHHGEDDPFPNGWANGQGTNEFGMPYLTLPDGPHLDVLNVYHEGFHIFQYEATSPGFAYAGDSQWYIEATAQWFAAKNFRDEVNAFIEVASLSLNPHLTLWHSFSNEAPGDPTDWLFQVRQYGMHAYLVYLTEQAGVDPSIVSRGFYEGTTLSPQEYHFDAIGADRLRGIYADWAAHNTGGFDYLTPAQWQRAIEEADWVGDANNRAPYAIELDLSALPESASPTERLTPRGWAYNVARIELDGTARTFDVRLSGDATGSEGATAHFEWRAVVMSASGPRYVELPMEDATTGEGSFDVGTGDTEAFVVIASVPDSFGGNQTYGYSLETTFASRP